MDFVSIWKAVSVATTGAFGVLGLLTENKDKITGHLTTWGRISLTGIMVSTCFGVAAQLKESSEETQRRDATAKQTLALIKQTGQTVEDIQRLLTPLDEPRFSIFLDGPCPPKKATCDILKSDQKFFSFQLYFFRREVDVSKLANPIRDKQFELEIDIISSNYAKDKSLIAGVYNAKEFLPAATVDDETATIMIGNYEPSIKESTGKILAVGDLDGATMVMTDTNDDLSTLKPSYFVIETKQGRKIRADTEQFIKIAVEGHPSYKYTFPIVAAK